MIRSRSIPPPASGIQPVGQQLLVGHSSSQRHPGGGARTSRRCGLGAARGGLLVDGPLLRRGHGSDKRGYVNRDPSQPGPRCAGGATSWPPPSSSVRPSRRSCAPIPPSSPRPTSPGASSPAWPRTWLSAAAAAFVGGEEERRDVERAVGADAPRICSTSVNALISAWRRSISLWRLAMGMSTRGGGRRGSPGRGRRRVRPGPAWASARRTRAYGRRRSSASGATGSFTT